MSLTSVVAANKPLFKAHVGRPDVRPSCPVVVPHQTDASWMGSSADYAIRAGLASAFDSQTRRPTWHTALKRLASHLGRDAEDFVALERRVVGAHRRLRRLESPDAFGLREAAAALQLGRMEVFARGGGQVERYLERMNDRPSELQARNLLAMFQLVTWEDLAPKHVLALNPTFGEGSHLVGGGDADIVVDDLLIEIKTLKESKLSAETLRQLVGYAVLANAFGVDDCPGTRIRRLGVLFARSGELVCFDLDEVCPADDQNALLEFFRTLEGGKAPRST